MRYAAKSIAMEEEYNIKISNQDIESILGPSHLERDKYENNESTRCCDRVGLDKRWWRHIIHRINFIKRKRAT